MRYISAFLVTFLVFVGVLSCEKQIPTLEPDTRIYNKWIVSAGFYDGQPLIYHVCDLKKSGYIFNKNGSITLIEALEDLPNCNKIKTYSGKLERLPGDYLEMHGQDEKFDFGYYRLDFTNSYQEGRIYLDTIAQGDTVLRFEGVDQESKKLYLTLQKEK
ncbi:MAG: hypothetical protein N4A45_06510 [Flavobacteriales bacterium]|jgi:hypothetical protein|nr:hypothetical protein [Flavobacteriales bacterium]